MKETIFAIFAAIGAGLTAAFGNWDGALITLCICMAADYVTGIVVAGVFHASKKSATGSLESRAGWKGLLRKCMTLLFVLIAYRVDLTLGTSYIRDGVIYGFMANELLSLVENAGLMGVPLPKVLTKAIDVLSSRNGGGDKEDGHE